MVDPFRSSGKPRHAVCFFFATAVTGVQLVDFIVHRRLLLCFFHKKRRQNP